MNDSKVEGIQVTAEGELKCWCPECEEKYVKPYRPKCECPFLKWDEFQAEMAKRAKKANAETPPGCIAALPTYLTTDIGMFFEWLRGEV